MVLDMIGVTAGVMSPAQLASSYVAAGLRASSTVYSGGDTSS